jgi:O-antigen ligase
VVLMLPGDSAKIAVLAGLAAGLAGQFLPRLTRWGLAAVAVLLVLGLPWIIQAVLPLDAGHLVESAAHRLLIWDFVSERIAERPLLGWGMDSSRAVPGGTGHPDAAMLAAFGLAAKSDWFSYAQLLPLHPHNLALQVWLELGAVGALR